VFWNDTLIALCLVSFMLSTSSPPPPTRVPDEVLNLLTGPNKPFEIGSTTVDGITFRHFVNAPANLAIFYRTRAERYANNTFVVFESERYTFAQIMQQAHSLAHHLQQQFGIERRDRVAIAMRNYPEWCIAFIAITSIGAICVPLNSWWSASELEYGLQDSGTKLLIADIRRYNAAKSACHKLSIATIVVDRKAPDSAKCPQVPSSVVRFSSLVASIAEQQYRHADESIAADQEAAIMYTSGTTGNPKGVVLTHRGILNQLVQVYAHIKSSQVKSSQQD
jgi:long-chain acyl-CoA synthetase